MKYKKNEERDTFLVDPTSPPAKFGKSESLRIEPPGMWNGSHQFGLKRG